MRKMQLDLLVAAMLCTTLGLSTAAWADQTAGTSVELSVETGAQYDEVVASEGLFRHRHARLMLLHKIAIKQGRSERAREIERLLDHLGENHAKSLHNHRAKMHQVDQALVDDLLSKHRAHSKQVKAELKSHEQTLEKHIKAREHEADRRSEALKIHAKRLQEERNVRGEKRDEATKDHRVTGRRRAKQHREAAEDQHKSHQQHANKQEDVVSRHHATRHRIRKDPIESQHDDARSGDEGHRNRQSVKQHRRNTDKPEDRTNRKGRVSRGYRGPSHLEAKEKAVRSIKPEESDRVFEKLRREIERKPGRKGPK